MAQTFSIFLRVTSGLKIILLCVLYFFFARNNNDRGEKNDKNVHKKRAGYTRRTYQLLIFLITLSVINSENYIKIHSYNIIVIKSAHVYYNNK